MAVADGKKLDEFCVRLFRILDGLDLLPRQLGMKRDKSGELRKIAPTEFEKHSRLLLGSIKRCNDVKAGFKEWESRLLREVKDPFVWRENYLELQTLFDWMIKNEDVIRDKTNMQHLRASLFARIFYYLYPRRVLVNAYCQKHRGNVTAIDEEFVKKDFPASISSEVKEIKEVFAGEWGLIVDDARASLLSNAAYYRKVLKGEELLLGPQDVEA